MTEAKKKEIIQVLKDSGWEKVVRCEQCRWRHFCKVTEYLGENGYCNNGEVIHET